MITYEKAEEFVKATYNETDVADRFTDRGFAYYVSTQPREYLDTKDDSKMTLGNGPMVIVKDTGNVYSFPSTPAVMFGTKMQGGISKAQTIEEFNEALADMAAHTSGEERKPVAHIE